MTNIPPILLVGLGKMGGAMLAGWRERGLAPSIAVDPMLPPSPGPEVTVVADAAAIPAGFIALLWPRLTSRSMWALALVSASVALVLVPFLQPGIPVLAAALVAVAADRIMARRDGRAPDGAAS